MASQTMIFFTTIVYIFMFEMCSLKNFNHCQNTEGLCHWIEIIMFLYTLTDYLGLHSNDNVVFTASFNYLSENHAVMYVRG